MEQSASALHSSKRLVFFCRVHPCGGPKELLRHHLISPNGEKRGPVKDEEDEQLPTALKAMAKGPCRRDRATSTSSLAGWNSNPSFPLLVFPNKKYSRLQTNPNCHNTNTWNVFCSLFMLSQFPYGTCTAA